MTITVDEKGNITVDAKGFKGKACTDTLNKLLAELRKRGLEPEITHQTKKEEAYATGVRSHASTQRHKP